MRGLRWRRAPRPDRMTLVDVDPEEERDPLPVLARIASEALILQDEAESVLAGVGRHEHLGLLAPRGGPLVRRFFALRDQLGQERRLGPVRADLVELFATLDTILLHHAMQVATALEFLAVEWRSPQMARQVGAMGGLGMPAEVLEDVYRQVRRLSTPDRRQ